MMIRFLLAKNSKKQGCKIQTNSKSKYLKELLPKYTFFYFKGLFPIILFIAISYFWLNPLKIILPYPPAGGKAKALKIFKKFTSKLENFITHFRKLQRGLPACAPIFAKATAGKKTSARQAKL